MKRFKRFSHRFFKFSATNLLVGVVSIVGCANLGIQSSAEREQASEITAATEANKLWVSGRKMVSDGEKTVSSGRKKIRQGRDIIRQGDSQIERGLQLVSTGRTALKDAVEAASGGDLEDRPLEKGTKLVQEGNVMIQQGNEKIRQGRMQVQEGRMMIDSGLSIMHGVESIYLQ